MNYIKYRTSFKAATRLDYGRPRERGWLIGRERFKMEQLSVLTTLARNICLR
jgi:hypothetical protein